MTFDLYLQHAGSSGPYLGQVRRSRSYVHGHTLRSSATDAVDWLNSESEVRQTVTALWLKSRSELETVNKYQPAENHGQPKCFWSGRCDLERGISSLEKRLVIWCVEWLLHQDAKLSVAYPGVRFLGYKFN